MQIRNGFIWLLKAAAAGLLAMGVLTLFCIMYWYNGLHIKSETGATDYVWDSNQLIVNMSEGFSVLRMDENGYNNALPIPESGIDVLLLGSSHMIATEIAKDESVGYLLNEMLPDMYTYNIGMDHHSLCHCVSDLRDALAAFPPKKYVVIEANSIELDIGEMSSVLEGTFGEAPAYDSGIMYFLQKYVPVAKQAYRQLRAAGLVERAEVKTIPEGYYTSDEYISTLDKFLEMAAAPLEETGLKMIIVAHPTTSLDEDGGLVLEINQQALDVFRAGCERHGIILVDLSEDYERLYAQEHALPYGFTNTQVGKGHMNKNGHRIMAERLSAVITSLEK